MSSTGKMNRPGWWNGVLAHGVRRRWRRMGAAAALATLLLTFVSVESGHTQSTGNTITGRVEYADGGGPSERIEVTLMLQLGGGSVRVFSDPGGRFVFQDLRPGAYRVSVTMPNHSPYLSGQTDVTIDGSATSSNYLVNILLERKSVDRPIVTGRTIDARETDRNVSKEARTLYRRGVEAAGRGEAREAIALFREALRIESDYLFALNDLGVQLTNLERFDESIAILERAISLAPSVFAPQLNLAIAFERKGALEPARNVISKALAIDPVSPEALFVSARIAHRLGDIEAAIDGYNRAFAEGGLDMIVTQIELGQLYERAGQRHAAINAYETYLSLVASGAEAEFARERLRSLRRT